MIYLNVGFISPPSHRKAWLSLSSAWRRVIFGNPNVRDSLFGKLIRYWES